MLRTILYALLLIVAMEYLMPDRAVAQSCELICDGDFDSLPWPMNAISYVNAATMPCWTTTDPGGIFEVWGNGYLGLNAYSGTHFLELNGNGAYSIFQPINVLPGSTVTIAFAHRGRSGTDTMSVSIGPVGGPFIKLGKFADGTAAWGYHTTSYTIPPGTSAYQIYFNADYAAGGPTVGNFLDAITVSTTCATFENTCFGDTTIFTVQDSASFLSIGWAFDDPNSGIYNNAYNAMATHVFTAPGTYNVQLITVFNVPPFIDTMYFPVTIVNKPAVNLGNDTTLCNGQALLLSPNLSGTYLWQNGTTSTSLNANAPGTYMVTVTQNGCANSDTVVILYQPCVSVVANLSSSDTIFCEKQCIDFYDLSLNQPTSWLWTFTGGSPSTSSDQHPAAICYNNYGSFDVQLIACNNVGCDTLLLPLFITELVSPAPPVITQSGDTLLSNVYNVTYAWYNTNNPNLVLGTSSYYLPAAPGSYYVVVSDTNGCEVASSSFVSNVGLVQYTSTGVSIMYHSLTNQLMCSIANTADRLITITIYDDKGSLLGNYSCPNNSQQMHLPAPNIQGLAIAVLKTAHTVYVQKLMLEKK